MAPENVVDPSRFRDPDRQTSAEIAYRRSVEQYIAESSCTAYEKFENFTKYASRRSLARFLALYEPFKQVIDVQGDVIECAVNWGALMGFALMSAILEPVNLQRRIIGFDTFSGFPDLSDMDVAASVEHTERKVGRLATDDLCK